MAVLISLSVSAQAPSISLDKMNVLYVGVENQITINDSENLNNTENITVDKGRIIGEGNKRKILINEMSDGKLTVNISKNGVVYPFVYHLIRVSDPVFKIGSGKSRMPCVEFFSQNYCRADFEDFDYGFRYYPVSFKITFKGTGFKKPKTVQVNGYELSAIKNLMNKCVSGTIVLIEDIMVSGPDGTRKISNVKYELF
jgi:hypothetical protein